jgi:hypothetical protein
LEIERGRERAQGEEVESVHFSAFRDEHALPSAVLGPRDFAPFFRLASARALLIGTAARATPTLDMAGFFR